MEGTSDGRRMGTEAEACSVSDLADEVLEAMDMDCGPVDAEPYPSWAKALALEVLKLEAENRRLRLTA